MKKLESVLTGWSRARWGTTAARLYDATVARGQEPLYRRLIAEAPQVMSGELLDVGCGPGHTALLLAQSRPGLRVVGIDSSAEMIRLARRAANESGRDLVSRVEFTQGDALALPFADARFDGALSFASIKHWPDRARGLRELHRVLRPGAQALLIEADRGAPDSVLEDYARNWWWLPAPALRLAFRGFIAAGSLELESARALLAESPFIEVSVERLPDVPMLAMRARKALAPTG